jgi:hypothetical protein
VSDGLTAGERDQRIEAAVLRVLLVEYPEQLTADELRLELVGPDPSFSDREEVDRAVRTLAHVGLVHQQGTLVWPSRAARYYFTLEVE